MHFYLFLPYNINDKLRRFFTVRGLGRHSSFTSAAVGGDQIFVSNKGNNGGDDGYIDPPPHLEYR